jgi:diaminopimelate epimerase
VRFHFFNNDGGRAAMCGNGALCATRIAAYLELATPAGMTLETDAGAYRSRCLDGPGERAELVLGDLEPASEPAVRLAAGERDARLFQVGVPHLVVEVDDVAQVSLEERGRALRFDPALGQAGANVNFVSQSARSALFAPSARSARSARSAGPARSARSALSALSAGEGGGGEWAMRTYERGVEAETLACGTGATAVAASLAAAGRASLPVQILTASGRALCISGVLRQGRLEEARLGGEGRLVFRAVLGEGPLVGTSEP